MNTITNIESICLRREEVRALQRDGRATVIRKLNPYPAYSGIEKFSFELHPFAPSTLLGTPAEGLKVAPERKVWIYEYWCGNIVGIQGDCPIGIAGERRWVKEVWADGVNTRIYKADFDTSDGFGSHVVDMATGDMVPLIWKSATTMPIDASRYTVEVESVTVEKRNNVWHWVAVVKNVEE